MEDYLPVVEKFATEHPIVATALASFGVTFIRLALTTLVFKPVGRLFVVSSAKSRIATIDKFCESAWFLTYYTTTFSYGIYTLWDAPWLWDYDHYWIGWPNQPFPFWMRAWYLFQLGNYVSASLFVLLGPYFSTSARTHHKDFEIMIVHHVVTVGLISLSDWCGYHRVGSVVLLVHDVSDIFLEFAKCLKYTGHDNAKNPAFGVFAVVFFISRLILHPWIVLYPVVIRSRIFMEHVPLGRTWDVLLGTLQCMHVYWIYLILRMALRLAKEGDAARDIRSDDEDEPYDEVDAKDKGNKVPSIKSKKKAQ